jgi:anaerobic ribonucleoside-triphosphate reductase activating protein
MSSIVIYDNKEVYISRIFTNNVDHPKLFGVSIYYSGCDVNKYYGHYCYECHNPETWIQEIGKKTTNKKLLEEVKNKLDFLFNTYDKLAVVFVGGEPLMELNKQSLLFISKKLKDEYNDKIINLLYTWRQPEHIKNQNLLHYTKFIDEFVLGRFEVEKKVEDKFPASLNQQYIKQDELLRQIKNI